MGRAMYGGERIGITRNGKLAAVVIPPDDLEALEEFEMVQDVAAYRQAKADDDGAQTAWFIGGGVSVGSLCILASGSDTNVRDPGRSPALRGHDERRVRTTSPAHAPGGVHEGSSILVTCEAAGVRGRECSAVKDQAEEEVRWMGAESR